MVEFNKTDDFIDKENDDCEVIEVRDRELSLTESVKAGEDVISRAGDDMADNEGRDRNSTTGSKSMFVDEGRGASIPNSMERTRESLVERRREDARAS